MKKLLIIIAIGSIGFTGCKTVKRVFNVNEKSKTAISEKIDSMVSVKKADYTKLKVKETIVEEVETTTPGKTVHGKIVTDLSKAISPEVRGSVNWALITSNLKMFDSMATLVSQSLDSVNGIITTEFAMTTPESKTKSKKTINRETEQGKKENTNREVSKASAIKQEQKATVQREQKVVEKTQPLPWYFSVPVLLLAGLLVAILFLYRWGLVGEVVSWVKKIIIKRK